MKLGDEDRGAPAAVKADCAPLATVSLGLASMVVATSAAAQQAAEPAPLPPLEVTTQKAKKQSGTKKAPSQKVPQTAAPAQQQGPTPAEAGNAQTQAFTPGSGNSLKAGTGIGRLPGSIQETPQVVNVISQQQLQQQNPTTVEQTLRNVPGVTVAIGEGGGGFNGDQFRIRGFEAKGDLYIDGLRDFGVYVRDSFATEEVQVLKGPASESFGAGTTGGVINLRQKSAHLGDANSVDFSIGTDNLYRAVIDVNKQINSTTAARAVGLYHSNDQPDRDHVESERWGFLGSIGFGLGTDTTWIVNYLHQTGERVPDYGVPNIRGRSDPTGGPVTEYGVPRSAFYGRIDDHDDTEADIITSRFQKNLSSQVTFYNDTRLAFFSRDFSTTVPGCGTGTITPDVKGCSDLFLEGSPAFVSIGGGNPTIVQDTWGIQNISSAVARFNAGGLKHEAVAGIDVFYIEDDRPGYGQAGKITNNTPVANPGATYTSGYSIVRNPANDRTSDGTEVGLFASDRVWLTEEFSVLAGVRWTTFDYNFWLRGGTPVPSIGGNAVTPIDGASEGDFWSPKVSLIWEPTKSQSYYVSWAKSASPVGQFVNNALNPITTTLPQNAVEENESWEAGAKWSILGDKLGLTAAIFQVEKNGVIAQDPANPNAVIQTGESQRVRGAEIGISGQVTKAWIVQAGYTYLDAEITKSTTTSNIGHDVGGVPDSAISLWTTYNLSESLIQGPGKWTVGGGILWQSEMFSVNNSANQYVIPDLFSLDAMVSYEKDGWRFAVNGYNLTDELNYDQSFNNRATPSAGRSGIFSVGKKF